MIETTVNLETLTGETSISLPPGTILGYRANGKPIYNIAGGDGRIEVGSDDDDDDDDVDDNDDDDSDNDDKNEWVPPSKEEFEKLMAAKSKADSEAAARKRFLRDAGLDPKTGKPVSKPKVEFDLDDDSDDEGDDDTRKPEAKSPSQVDVRKTQRDLQRQLEREVAKAETRERERALTLVSAVPEALSEAELNPKYLKRALKLMDLDSVEVDSDGEVDGLLEQIDELKKDFPEFFKRTRMKDAAKDVADVKTVGGGRKKAPESKANLGWADQIAAAIQRGGN